MSREYHSPSSWGEPEAARRTRRTPERVLSHPAPDSTFFSSHRAPDPYISLSHRPPSPPTPVSHWTPEPPISYSHRAPEPIIPSPYSEPYLEYTRGGFDHVYSVPPPVHIQPEPQYSRNPDDFGGAYTSYQHAPPPEPVIPIFPPESESRPDLRSRPRRISGGWMSRGGRDPWTDSLATVGPAPFSRTTIESSTLTAGRDMHIDTATHVHNHYHFDQVALEQLQDILHPVAAAWNPPKNISQRVHSAPTLPRDIEPWISDTEAQKPPIYVLEGAKGKDTALAANVIESALSKGVVVASYINPPKSDEQKSARNSIVGSIAYQLAHHIPDFCHFLMEAVQSRKGAKQQDVSEDFSTLVVQPLQATQSLQSNNKALKVLIVIDGVEVAPEEDVKLVLAAAQAVTPALGLKMLVIPSAGFDITAVLAEDPSSRGQIVLQVVPREDDIGCCSCSFASLKRLFCFS